MKLLFMPSFVVVLILISFSRTSIAKGIAVPEPRQTRMEDSNEWIEVLDHSDVRKSKRGNFFECFNGKRILWEDVCNHQWDCLNGGDEIESCEPAVDGDTFVFQSPNYPASYPSDNDIIWTFTAEEGSMLIFHCLDFATEKNHDVLRIGEGLNPIRRTKLASFTGDTCSDISTVVGALWVQFYSDTYNSNKGFQGEIEIIDTCPSDPSVDTAHPYICDHQWDCKDGSDEDNCPPMTQSFTIASPNYPNKYGNMVDIVWTFTAEEGSTLKFVCTKFETENQYDYLYIGNSLDPTDEGSVLATLTGKNCENVTISGNAMWIRMQSDKSLSRKGFTGTVEVETQIDTPSTSESDEEEIPDLCGYNDQIVDVRIVGGQNATIEKHPWQVVVTFKADDGYHHFMCGGTLITTRHVLTAAHCFRENEDPMKWGVVLGTSKPFSFQLGEGQFIEVQKIMRHPEFNDSGGVDNDVAVLELAEDVTIPTTLEQLAAKPPVNSACLDIGEDVWDADSSCFITGFGAINVDGTQLPDILQESDIIYMDSTECERETNFHGTDKIKASMICGKSPDDSNQHDSCQGDSGGPLVCRGSRLNYVVVGITSWGISCGNVDHPGVYTNVAYFASWIQEQMI